MKSIMPAAFIAVAAAVFAFFAIPADAAPVGTFTHMEGRADLTPPGGAAKAVGKGDPVNVGDVIRVKSKSRAEVSFNDGNVLRLAANTRLRITQYMFGKDVDTDERLNLYRGKIKVMVNTAIKGAGRFEVHMPNSVAGVRGTFWYNMVFSNGSSSTAVLEGTVAMTSAGRTVMLGAGRSASAGPGQPIHVYRTPQHEIQQLERETSPGAQQSRGGGDQGVINSLFGQNSSNNLLTDGQVNVIIPFSEVPPAAPVFSSSLTVPVTGNDAIGFTFTPETNITYSYRLDSGEWTATSGPDVNLMNIGEGLHTFELRAASLSGGTSSTSYQWFVGNVQCPVDGLVSGSLTGVVDTGNSEGIRLLSARGTGAWSILTNSSAPVMSVPSSISLVSGGTAADPDFGTGYWISRIGAISDGSSITGTSSLTAMNRRTMGSGSGTVGGTVSPDQVGYYVWSLYDYGLNYTESWLSFYNSFSPSSKYMSAGQVHTDGSFTMHMGGLGSLWTSSSASFYGLGLYDPGQSGFSLPKIWRAEIYSDNIDSGFTMTYDGGAYRGYMSGIVRPASASTALLEGDAALLYVDNNGADRRMGILTGSLSGTCYPAPGMAEVQGTLQRVDMGASPLEPANLTFGLQSFEHGSGSGAFTLGGSDAVYTLSFTQPTGYAPMYLKYITGAPAFGIFQTEIYGLYDNPASFDGWYFDVDGATSILAAFPDQYSGLSITGTSWSGSRLSGTAVGYWADIGSALGPATGVMAGKVLGTYNSSAQTFQSVITGSWLETNKLLTMINTGSSPNVAALQALNIPCFEVGRATLSGTNGLSYVTLNNVIFLASSTGAVPSIWATGSVSGVNQVGAILAVPVNGGGLSATFQMRKWNESNGVGNWMATVDNGSGSIAGGGPNVQNLQFKGVAAGSFTGLVNFTGTAAGAVKQGAQ